MDNGTRGIWLTDPSFLCFLTSEQTQCTAENPCYFLFPHSHSFKNKKRKKNDLGNQGPVKGPWEAQTDPTNFSQRKAI